MSKWVLDQYAGPELDYATLGFLADTGDILDASAAPDPRWSLNGDQGATETVSRYTLGGDPDYVEPGDGHFLAWDDTQNTYVPVNPASVLGGAVDAAITAIDADPDSDFRGQTDARYAGRVSRARHAPAFALYFPEAEGAVGDGTTNDTTAVQDALDAATAAGGGTLVLDPQLTYVVEGIVLGSHTRIQNPGRLKLEDPETNTAHLLSTATYTTTGNISAAGSALTVADASNVEEGCIVSVQGAGGASAYQATTLSAGITAGDTTIPLTATTGFRTTGGFYIIDSEIVSGDISGSNLVSVTRGLFGTTAASHLSAATVAAATRSFGVVESIAGSVLTLHKLDAPHEALSAAVGVTGAEVTIGSVDIKISDAILDGNRAATDEFNNSPILFDHARFCGVEGVRTSKGDHDSIFVTCSADNVISGCIIGPSGHGTTGATIWLFGNNHRNRIIGNSFLCDGTGVYLDDRSVSWSEFDGANADNVIAGNTFEGLSSDTGSGAVQITGSVRNSVTGNTMRRIGRGVMIAASAQGTTPRPTSQNVVTGNAISASSADLWISGISSVTDNIMVGNVLAGSGTISGFNAAKPFGNVFIGNGATESAFQGKISTTGELEVDGALNHDGTTVGFNGSTPVGKRTLGAAATDAATTQTLANNLRTALIDLGLGQT